MIPFLGSCPVRQVVKNKPKTSRSKKLCFDIKCWAYLDFEIQQGATTPLPDTSLRHGPALVLRLVETLTPSSSVFLDIHFTTIPLLQLLTELNIDGTGILQTNRI